MNSAAVATQVKDVQGDGRWMSMHRRQCSDCNLQKPDILFIGDSIIHRMEDTDVWAKKIRPLCAVNAGIGGDSTQHVLWRIENGLFDLCSPKIVVVLVGTNNHDHTSDEITEALEAIVWNINSRVPNAKIVILGLLPRGERPNELREKIYQINYGIEHIIRSLPNAYFLNADPGFLRNDGTISPEDMSDYLHLTRRGVDRFCTPIVGFIKKLLSEMKETGSEWS